MGNFCVKLFHLCDISNLSQWFRRGCLKKKFTDNRQNDRKSSPLSSKAKHASELGEKLV